MTTPKFIDSIVYDFYSKAVIDPIIGFHFRKIQEFEGTDPLRPPMEAFAGHLPRISSFWQIQLLPGTKQVHPPYNLKKAHDYLGLRPGQVNRWIILFNETLDTSNGDVLFINRWKEKLTLLRPFFP